MKTEHRFKEGDKVKFISKSSSNAKYFKRGLDNLEIRSLVKASEYDYQVYESDKSQSWGVKESEIELQEDTTDLTGRYVKALIDKPTSISFCKKGDCYLIEADDDNYLSIKNILNGSVDWLLSKKLMGIEWELMPKDFNPNKSEEPFAIQLHSQEELDTIMSFYKEKGYKMLGSSDYYLDDFVVYIRPENKTWQTAVLNIENYPFKTLSELGITVNTTPQFKVNRWYKFDAHGVKNQYGKLKSINNNTITCSPWICISDYRKEGNWDIDSWKNYELLTDLSEIQKYLPLGHPDLIVNNNSMYKVGDFVTDDNGRNVYKYGKFENDRHYPMSWGVLTHNKREVDSSLRFGQDLRKVKLEEIKTDLLSEDELLQVAKQFYPVGTKFRTIYGENKIGTVKLNDANYFEKHRNPLNITITVEEYEKDCPKWSIHSKAKGWAKIINSPIQESDNFVLPEKWCITTTKESNDIICDWYVKYNNSHYLDRTIGNHFCMNGKSLSGWMNSAPKRKEGYTEITFEQFKKYVLNKSEVVKENGSGLTTKAEKVRDNYENPTFHEDSFEYEYEPLVQSKSSKKLTSPKIIPIKVRNCNITETKPMSTRTRVKIIKKSII